MIKSQIWMSALICTDEGLVHKIWVSGWVEGKVKKEDFKEYQNTSFSAICEEKEKNGGFWENKKYEELVKGNENGFENEI